MGAAGYGAWSEYTATPRPLVGEAWLVNSRGLRGYIGDRVPGLPRTEILFPLGMIFLVTELMRCSVLVWSQGTLYEVDSGNWVCSYPRLMRLGPTDD